MVSVQELLFLRDGGVPRPRIADPGRRVRVSRLALTDANLCGALEFARPANSLGIKPVAGGKLALTDWSRIVLLAKKRQGYGNISRLFTLALQSQLVS